jgi:hypothetical protein
MPEPGAGPRTLSRLLARHVAIVTTAAALLEFSDSELGRKYLAEVSARERAWDRFIPFL